MTPSAIMPGEPSTEVERVKSFVPGLDEVLGGGFLRGGLYMLSGAPGMGKTILANQIIYGHAAGNGFGLFVTVLGENHGRMVTHLSTLSFFDASRIPDQVAYISAYKELEDKGLEGLTNLLRREIIARKAKILVLDGLTAVSSRSDAEFEMKRFVHELQTLASLTNCTMFLLTNPRPNASTPENTMVDGLIEMQLHRQGSRTERRLSAHKLRGSAPLEGDHAYHITGEGLMVFPRTEALLARPTVRGDPDHARVALGVASIDALMGGGLPAATLTTMIGPSGGGKTTLGLHFLSCSSASEPGLLFGCFEPPERLRRKSARMGFDMAGAEERGEIEVLWYPVGEYMLDELAHRLLDAVRRRGVKRLLVDGLTVFQQATMDPERLIRFWSALSNELRALGVTTVQTLELPELVGGGVRLPKNSIGSLAETIILVRYVELHSRLHRLISLFKVREGHFDPSIREFSITDAGVIVGKRFEGVEAVLSGMPRLIIGAASPLLKESPETGDQGRAE